MKKKILVCKWPSSPTLHILFWIVGFISLPIGLYCLYHWPDVPLSLVNENQKANKKSAEKSSIKQSQNLL